VGRRSSVRVPLNLWTLERFGLTPSGLRRRVVNPGGPRVLCVSVPKSGTHLLERALCLHPQIYRKLVPTVTLPDLRKRGGMDRLLGRVRPGQVLMTHLRFDPEYPDVIERHGVAPVFLIRDPRDVIVSQVRYAVGREDHWAHDLFAERGEFQEQLRLAITGDRERGLRSLGERLAVYEGWLDAAALVVRFEDLVGPEGGGDRRRQIEIVTDLFRAIGADSDDELVQTTCSELFSPKSPTFRKGTIGQWREVLDDELTALVRDLAGPGIERFGYEP